MSVNLEKICRVDIALSSPVANRKDFDNVLIVGPAPKKPKGTAPDIAAYSSLEELAEYGVVASGEAADPVGVAARVAFSQEKRPRSVYVAFVKKVSSGDHATADQDIDIVLNTAAAVNGWYCICPVGLTKEQVKKALAWTETHDKICGYVELDPSNPATKGSTYMRSFAVYPKENSAQLDEAVPAENLHGAAVAMAVAAMSYHSGEETWAMKRVRSIVPTSVDSATLKNLETNKISYMPEIASQVITMGGKTNGGEWIDIIRFRDWLKNDMQTRIVNLFLDNPKVPYTDGGISLVENQMQASLKDGQKFGGICQTEFDNSGNEVPGYTIHVPLASEVSAEQKSTRVLTDCTFTARLAGAIHVAEISGQLTYEAL